MTDFGEIKALTFDVFGTVVDWRSGIIRDGEALGRAKGLGVDWARFADAWRGLYQPALSQVRAPTLLIVGGRDDVVIGLNRQAEAQLRCEHRFEIVPGATHLFEEPGTLDAAAELARDWFVSHFTR